MSYLMRALPRASLVLACFSLLSAIPAAGKTKAMEWPLFYPNYEQAGSDGADILVQGSPEKHIQRLTGMMRKRGIDISANIKRGKSVAADFFVPTDQADSIMDEIREQWEDAIVDESMPEEWRSPAYIAGEVFNKTDDRGSIEEWLVSLEERISALKEDAALLAGQIEKMPAVNRVLKTELCRIKKSLEACKRAKGRFRITVQFSSSGDEENP